MNTDTHISPLLHLTNQCNLACKYCYTGSPKQELEDLKNEKTSIEENLPIIYSFIDQVMEFNNYKDTTILLHGGEPLLIGIEIWEKILTYISEKHYKANLDVQTNGTLLNDDFIDLIKRNNITIGISLDGPENEQNSNRLMRGGEGSFMCVLNNILKLQSADVRFGCLVTLNKTNLDTRYLYSFFKKKNFPFGIRPIFKNRYANFDDLLISDDEYAEAFCNLFDEWFTDQSGASLIRDFSRLISGFLKYDERLSLCTFSKDCSRSFITLDRDGNVWPCNSMMETPFLYGSLKTSSLNEILNTDKVKSFSRRWEILSQTECERCEWASYCHGGCPSRAQEYNGDYYSRDPFCTSYRKIFAHIHKCISDSIQ